jgi:hypothetical protein
MIFHNGPAYKGGAFFVYTLRLYYFVYCLPSVNNKIIPRFFGSVNIKVILTLKTNAILTLNSNNGPF